MDDQESSRKRGRSESPEALTLTLPFRPAVKRRKHSMVTRTSRKIFRLLDLPGELRDMVYRAVFEIPAMHYGEPLPEGISSARALRLTCKQVAYEAYQEWIRTGIYRVRFVSSTRGHCNGIREDCEELGDQHIPQYGLHVSDHDFKRMRNFGVEIDICDLQNLNIPSAMHGLTKLARRIGDCRRIDSLDINMRCIDLVHNVTFEARSVALALAPFLAFVRDAKLVTVRRSCPVPAHAMLHNFDRVTAYVVTKMQNPRKGPVFKLASSLQ